MKPSYDSLGSMLSTLASNLHFKPQLGRCFCVLSLFCVSCTKLHRLACSCSIYLLTLLALVWVCLQSFASKVIFIIYNRTYMCTRTIKTIQFHYIVYTFLFLLFILIEHDSIYSASIYLLLIIILLFCLC